MEKWRCHSETQSLVYALLILIDLIVIIIDLIFLTAIWCGYYFYYHLIDRETEEQRLSKLLKVTLIFVYSSKQWTWLLETQVILLSFHQRNSTLELFSGVRNVSAFVSSRTAMIWENIWGKQHGSVGILTVSFFVCQMCLWSGEDCTTSVRQNFIWESGTGEWIYTNNQISGFPKNYYTSLHRKDKQLAFALCNVLILHSKTTTKTTALDYDSSWNLTVSTNKHQFLTTKCFFKMCL